MKITRYIFLTIAGFWILAPSCKSPSDQSVWDSTAGTYTIPSLQITYAIPTEVGDWAVADFDRSVPELKFCGVDNNSVICILIVEPNKVERVRELNTKKVWALLYEMICQSSVGPVLRFNPDIEKERYLDADSWKFRTDVLIASDCDTVGVTYAGYFFESPNRKTVGILSIVPTSVLDSTGTQILDKYFEGVRFFTDE